MMRTYSPELILALEKNLELLGAQRLLRSNTWNIVFPVAGLLELMGRYE
jgi:hypothetical protein